MSLHLTLQAADDPTLQQLIVQQSLSLDDVLRLKAQSAKFYRTDSAQARAIAEQALRLSRFLPAPALAYGQWTLANSLIYEEDYQGAARLFAEARSELLAHNLLEDCARMSVGYVGALAYGAQARQGLAIAAESIELLRRAAQTDHTDTVRLVNLLMNTGVCHELLGQYEEALQVSTQLLELAKHLNNSSIEAQIRLNRATTLMMLNAFDDTLVELLLAEPIFQAEATHADLLRLYTNQARVLTVQKRINEAFSALTRATDQLTQFKDEGQQRHMLTRMRAGLILASGMAIDEHLLKELNLGVQAFATYGPVYEECLTRLYLGICYTRLHQSTQAKETLKIACTLAQRAADRVLEHLALHGLGTLAAQEAQIDTAIEFFKEAIAVIDAVRNPLRIELFRAGFVTDKLAVYHDLAAAYFATGHQDMAFRVVEETKARLLSEKLTYRLQDKPTHPSHTGKSNTSIHESILKTKLSDALENLDGLYQQREVTRQRKSDSSNAAEQALQHTLQHAIHKAEQKVTSLTDELQRNHAQYGALELAPTESLANITQCLNQAIYLQYHLVHQEVWLFVLNYRGIQYHGRLCSLIELESTCQLWEASVAHVLGLAARLGMARLAPFAQQLNQEAQKHLAHLYKLLIRPVEAWLPPNVPLIISPDDLLHSLPFHAFYDGQHYLVETHPITYTPSATVWMLKQGQKRQPGRWLLLGFDHGGLAGVDQEINAIITLLRQRQPEAKMIGDNDRYAWYLKEEATATSFLENAASSSLIHLAAHAHFRLDQPMLSSITLADRRLSLAEISRLQLDASLVVLSACETGRGQLRGADFISLAAGFLGAGARSLLVSLWRTEDQMTTKIMIAFYRALLDNLSVAEALRTAILDILGERRSLPSVPLIALHPAFWAPFVVIGDGSVGV